MPALPKQRKIAIVGSRSVGKSSLTVQFVEGHFVESYYPTIENTFSRLIKCGGQEFATEIVDTAGQGAAWVPMMIVGNKSDLKPEQRQVSAEEGQAMADEFKCGFTEASARLNTNVSVAFEHMVAEIEKREWDLAAVVQRTSEGSCCDLFANAALTMLDVIDFIQERGGNPNLIRENQRRRYAPEEAVDEVIGLYEDHRATKYEAQQVGSKINVTQTEIGKKKKAKENADDLVKIKGTLQDQKKKIEESALEKEAALHRKIKTIGNYVHDSVPISNNEENNGRIRTWAPEGTVPTKKDCLSHHEVLTRLDGYDPERGVKIVGHRGYCLTGYGLFLNLALVNYGLEFLWRKGYKPNQPPHFMLRDYMAKTAQLEQFDEELYKVTDDGQKQTDKYLIATSEQPLSAIHDGEWLQDKDLPIRYAGYSTCYRKEAGAHGKDAWGIFRVHQFEKIEQFLITKPEASWEAFDNMIALSEEFYQSLGLPYQIVAIVSGALNNAAAKKYDLEAWFPFQGEYKELVSCSNCTDYQSRALDIRYGTKTAIDAKKKYVHALNSTLCATERALCCVLENYQTDSGIIVPEVLRKYIPGAPEFIEYSRELPKDSTSQKAKGKASGPKLPATGDVANQIGNLNV
ncbi:MAG: hypothetical protein LQ350_001126 [Teloschistes chrysophthalmus]|nr:MAG: hypothetical protein LQ350_001126 [Niorma chrysophthalma]